MLNALILSLLEMYFIAEEGLIIEVCVTLTCDVIHHHSYSGVSYIAWDKAPKTFLACRVPQLQPNLQVRDPQLNSQII